MDPYSQGPKNKRGRRKRLRSRVPRVGWRHETSCVRAGVCSRCLHGTYCIQRDDRAARGQRGIVSSSLPLRHGGSRSGCKAFATVQAMPLRSHAGAQGTADDSNGCTLQATRHSWETRRVCRASCNTLHDAYEAQQTATEHRRLRGYQSRQLASLERKRDAVGRPSQELRGLLSTRVVRLQTQPLLEPVHSLWRCIYLHSHQHESHGLARWQGCLTSCRDCWGAKSPAPRTKRKCSSMCACLQNNRLALKEGHERGLQRASSSTHDARKDEWSSRSVLLRQRGSPVWSVG